jgi:hypothetical protein
VAVEFRHGRTDEARTGVDGFFRRGRQMLQAADDVIDARTGLDA